jgi:putative nucleotidyltransferase with HDIG domain
MPTTTGDKEKREQGSVRLLAEHLQGSLLERLSSGRHHRRNKFILLLLTALSLTILVIPSLQYVSGTYKEGEIASTDIRATRDYLLEDRRLTEAKQLEAENAVPYVYSLFANPADDAVRDLAKVLDAVHDIGLAPEARRSLRDALAGILGTELSDAELDSLEKIRSDQSFLADARKVLERVYEGRVVNDKRLFTADSAHGIVMVDSRTGTPVGAVDVLLPVRDVAEARSIVAEGRFTGTVDSRNLAALRLILPRVLKPSLTLNREATDYRKRMASEGVKPVQYQLKQGEMIVRSGERISAEQAVKLNRVFAGNSMNNRMFIAGGLLCLVFVLLYAPYRFACKNIRKFNPTEKDILLLSLLSLGVFATFKMGLVVAGAMGGVIPYIHSTDFYYAFPFAFGPMLVRIVLNSEVALVYCAICAPLLGIMFDNSLPVVIYGLMGGIVGAHGVRQCKNRGALYTAGLKVSVVNVALALCFQIQNDSFISVQTLYCVTFAFFGGLLNAALVTGIVPLVENLFQYTTDIKLLELSSLNSPILRDLMVRAPGTYHHSILVGNLVEAAAEAINANPMLARVAAYYHDVGKTSKPQYFIENIGTGENRHDKLSPNMSALILISHVKEGVELAKEHRLGMPIIDIIRQSHGTGLITYFYDKARKQAVVEGKTVDEQDFRYPGPKPQTREAGLVMLADSVEAASRTLTDPTPARIQGLVQKIINNIFIDGQLDECELTLKNLHEIAKSFNRVLAGIYHHRISYPTPAFKEKAAGGRNIVEDSVAESPETAEGRREEGKKSGGDDLKRLGISR